MHGQSRVFILFDDGPGPVGFVVTQRMTVLDVHPGDRHGVAHVAQVGPVESQTLHQAGAGQFKIL